VEEVVYRITEAAGIVWVSPSIWMKERPTVNAAQARELLAQGRKDGTYEAPIPDDDKKALSEATDLLDMAQTAWEQHVRGPEVEILLKMAANFEEGGNQENGSPPPEPKQEQDTKEEKPKRDEPKPDAERPRRQRPTPKEPEPEPEPQEDDLSQIEPWDGYDREKVSDIISGVNAGADSYSEAEFLDLMRNVWEYEAAHKARKAILNHLEAVAKNLQNGEDPPPAPEEGDKEPEPEPEQKQPEPEPEPEKEPEPESEEGDQDKQEERQEKLQQDDKREQKQERKQEDLGGDEYDEMMRKIDDELERERLHKPIKPPEDVDTEIPWDWTKISDTDLRRLHGVYSAMAYYKAYHAVLDERKEIACKSAADEIHNALMLSIEKDDERGKEKRVAILEAEIESDDAVKIWRRRQRRHATFAAAHKNERDSYGKIAEALSRHMTVRHEEWERSGGKRG
jgi:hypothetical protein